MAGRGDIQAGRAFVELFLKNRMTPALSKALLAAKQQLNGLASASRFVGGTFNKLSGIAFKAGGAITIPFLAAASRLKEGKVLFEDIGNAISEALGKPILPIIAQVRVVVRQFAQWAKQNPELIRTIFKIGVGLTIAGVALKVVGSAAMIAASGLAVAATAMGALAAVVAFVGTPFGALVALIIGSVAAWARFTRSGQAAMEHIRGLFIDIGRIGRETFQGIADAIMAGDLRLAAEVAWAGIMLVWHKGTADINRLWEDAKFFFLAVWSEATSGTAKMFVSLWAGIQRGWVEMVAAFRSSWLSLTSLISDSLTLNTAGLKNMGVMAALVFKVATGQMSTEQASGLWQAISQANVQGAIKNIGTNTISTDSALGEIDQARALALTGINNNEADARGILDEDQRRRIDGLNRKREADIAAKQKAVDDARRAFDEVRGRAKEAAEARKLAPVPELDLGGGSKPTVTFSGTALGLAGQGGGPGKELVKVAKEQDKKLGVIHQDLIKLADKKVVFE